jgi:hypothetical protein
VSLLATLAGSGLAAAVLTGGATEGAQFPVLATVVDIAVGAGGDAATAKAALACLCAFVRAWLPAPAPAPPSAPPPPSPPPPTQQQQQQQQQQQPAPARGAPPSTPPAPAPPPAAPPPPSPPLPPPLLAPFLRFAVEGVASRAVWGAVASPAFDAADAQGAEFVGEALRAHALVAGACSAALGGAPPSMPPPPGAPPDALAAFAGPANAALMAGGVPRAAAGAYEERLRACLAQPKDARAHFLEVARCLRAAAAAAAAAASPRG